MGGKTGEGRELKTGEGGRKNWSKGRL